MKIVASKIWNVKTRPAIFFVLIIGSLSLAYLNRGSFSLLTLTSGRSFSFIDFDTSMQSEAYPDVSHHPEWAKVLALFRTVYNRFELTKVIPGVQKIPKIMHCIWLGSELPAEYEDYYRSWLAHHPGWVFIFWTDTPLNYDRGSSVVASFDDVERVLASVTPGTRVVVDTQKLDFNNAQYFYGSPNYGEKSDILKWEIVYRFGGVYIDTDFECLAPLDYLHMRYDFYTGLQPLDTHMVQLGAALFAATPHHPILRACVDGIQYNQHITAIVNKTGPLHFTRCFSQYYAQDGRCDIAFPASFFYPCSYEQKGLPREVWIKPESFAVHHWAGSWLKDAGFVKAKK